MAEGNPIAVNDLAIEPDGYNAADDFAGSLNVLCSEHGENHLVSYIDRVRYDEALPPKAWRMTRTWALTRAESSAAGRGEPPDEPA